MKKLFLLTFVFFLAYCSNSYAENTEAANERKLINSKYGELTLRRVDGYTYIDAERRGNIFISLDPVIDVVWKNSADMLKANLFVLSTEKSSPTCPIAYIVMDLHGDVPMFSAPLASCAKEAQVEINLMSNGGLKIVSIGESEIESNTWIYKDGIILEQ